MKQLKKKLHSNSGASIILALAIMLICVMVSSVIVVMAASGINRNETNVERNQEYLAITSAAQYIAQNLNSAGNDSFSGVHLKNEMPCNRYKNYSLESYIRVNGTDVDAYAIPSQHVTVEADEPGLVSVEQVYLYVQDTNPAATTVNIFCAEVPKLEVIDASTSFSGTFSEVMREAVEEVFVHAMAYEKEFTMKVDDARVQDVKCKFTMDTDYNVEVVIRSVVAGSEYSMVVQMKARTPQVNAAGLRTLQTCSHRCFYEYCDNVGNIQTSEIKEYTFKHEIDNATTTVSWEKPIIMKGDAAR